MQVKIAENWPKTILMVRDENDLPMIERPMFESMEEMRKAIKAVPGIYNRWRDQYDMAFDSEQEAKAAVERIKSLGDFDKAAAWLDKQ